MGGDTLTNPIMLQHLEYTSIEGDIVLAIRSFSMM